MIFIGNEEDLSKEIVKRIIAAYSLDEKNAEKLSKDLIDEIKSHGGNPYDLEQVQQAIQVVVKKWLKYVRDK